MSLLQLRSMIGFVFQNRGGYFIAVLIVLLVLIMLSAFGIEMTTAGKFWTDHVDPFVGMAVLTVALALWFGEIRQDWCASLPCRLTVVFRHGDGVEAREVMRCERAGLSGEGEMRALGQQIGAQMVGERALDFCAPSVEYSGGHIEAASDGSLYRHFTVALRLRSLPATIRNLAPNEVLVWRPPFVSEPVRETHA